MELKRGNGYQSGVFFRFAYSLNRDSGITMGLSGAIQRLIVNGDSYDDLVGLAKDSRGIKRYIGFPCEDPDVKVQVPKCKNKGICRPELKDYKCQCQANFIGMHCEKGTLEFRTHLLHNNSMDKAIKTILGPFHASVEN